MSSNRRGPPKHQNQYAWKPNAGHKINETEVGGRLRPYSQITGVCARCKDQIDWKRRYGKYKSLVEPAKCQRCGKRAVRQAYHSICSACSKALGVCAKCSCHVDRIIGRDIMEVEAEQKVLDEAIRSARERDRRTLLRAMNKGKSSCATKTPTVGDRSREGDLFPVESVDEYADLSREDDDDEGSDEEDHICN
ncbi:uncharacterized protein LOC131228496 [Magnolia sinica]|uniref:uncharacterized protein LOC131228496 n=1 Tax=Magnolia sinica TaxID=86752 RepID=UPI0026596E09|nr:uncharacterized protein LOC131228496 [Magnolia sinica]